VNWGRTSGVLLHITSLPGRYGIGELGPEALRFADWLAEAGQRVWQILPIGPVGYGESPYQLFSAFAGNPLLISIDTLVERGWLSAGDIGCVPRFAQGRVEFERVVPWKTKLLHRAFRTFRERAVQAERDQFRTFHEENGWWLDDYARFMALKELHHNAVWTEWNREAAPSEDDLDYHKFVQFEFFRQWDALRKYCADRCIYLMGDLAIYLAHDSADVWTHPDLFQLDERGNPAVVAGVPPDYFSATGQRWGNPIYRWDRMAATGFRWWVERMRAALRMFDAVRMDHFRGFEAYWEVPAREATAVNGRWVKGPGNELFRALEMEFGRLPVVAENLGLITPEVEALRREFGFPGMAVLQFAFGTDAQARSFRPHRHVKNLVAYTGTHDNDTAIGWWRSQGGDSTRTTPGIEEERARARAYLATDGHRMNWVLIRSLMMSVADTVVYPMQDVLGLGSEARMNTPAALRGNWRWRCRAQVLSAELAERLRRMAELYERSERVRNVEVEVQ
jgi:4-alpha-glucanotransferase